jgi:hypothetical protein
MGLDRQQSRILEVPYDRTSVPVSQRSLRPGMGDPCFAHPACSKPGGRPRKWPMHKCIQARPPQALGYLVVQPPPPRARSLSRTPTGASATEGAPATHRSRRRSRWPYPFLTPTSRASGWTLRACTWLPTRGPQRMAVGSGSTRAGYLALRRVWLEDEDPHSRGGQITRDGTRESSCAKTG